MKNMNFLSIRILNDLHMKCELNHHQITNTYEPWKDGIKKGLVSCKSRFHEHFTPNQQKKVRKALDSFL